MAVRVFFLSSLLLVFAFVSTVRCGIGHGFFEMTTASDNQTGSDNDTTIPGTTETATTTEITTTLFEAESSTTFLFTIPKFTTKKATTSSKGGTKAKPSNITVPIVIGIVATVVVIVIVVVVICCCCCCRKQKELPKEGTSGEHGKASSLQEEDKEPPMVSTVPPTVTNVNEEIKSGEMAPKEDLSPPPMDSSLSPVETKVPNVTKVAIGPTTAQLSLLQESQILTPYEPKTIPSPFIVSKPPPKIQPPIYSRMSDQSVPLKRQPSTTSKTATTTSPSASTILTGRTAPSTTTPKEISAKKKKKRKASSQNSSSTSSSLSSSSRSGNTSTSTSSRSESRKYVKKSAKSKPPSIVPKKLPSLSKTPVSKFSRDVVPLAKSQQIISKQSKTEQSVYVAPLLRNKSVPQSSKSAPENLPKSGREIDKQFQPTIAPVPTESAPVVSQPPKSTSSFRAASVPPKSVSQTR